jgi:hypothetical protein
MSMTERPLLQARQCLEHHLPHDVAVGQHGDEDIRVPGRLAHRAPVALPVRIERLKGIAGRRDMGGHRPAHRAEADEGYSFDAKTSFAQRNATTAAGTPQ